MPLSAEEIRHRLGEFAAKWGGKRGPDGRIMDVKTSGGRFKGVRRER